MWWSMSRRACRTAADRHDVCASRRAAAGPATTVQETTTRLEILRNGRPVTISKDALVSCSSITDGHHDLLLTLETPLENRIGAVVTVLTMAFHCVAGLVFTGSIPADPTTMSRWRDCAALGTPAVLLWVNAYVCRDWFNNPTAQMNSLDGYWASLAGWRWLAAPQWWPFWDSAFPSNSPRAVVPAMTAAIARYGMNPI